MKGNVLTIMDHDIGKVFQLVIENVPVLDDSNAFEHYWLKEVEANGFSDDVDWMVGQHAGFGDC